jgi:NAD(P)H-nitrite reductase large subunit
VTTDPEEVLRVDDEEDLCICFHVKRRQIAKFLRLEQPRHASQCSECYGAGTGCGWCVPFIEKMFELHQSGVRDPGVGMTPGEYRARRQEHLRRTATRRPASAAPEERPAVEAEGRWIDEILPEDGDA